MNNYHLGVEEFAKRAVIVAAIALALVVILYLLYFVANVLIWIFACILLAVFLDGGATYLERRTPLPRSGALGLIMALLVAGLALVGFLSGGALVEQFDELTQRIPAALESIEKFLKQYQWIQSLISDAPQPREILPFGPDVVGSITGIFSTALGGAANVFIVLFIGVYLALNPALYIDNLIRLLPQRGRERAYEVFGALGRALRWWLAGRLASMLVVGILTTVGLWIARVPLALALGIIAALLSFVPLVGPALSSIPAMLIALVEGPTKVLHVIIVFSAVQALESYFITPLIQQRAVSIPPALLLTSQILFGVLFGSIGVLFATPMAVVLIVLVQMLYVEDVLGDSTVVLGDQSTDL